MLVSDKVMPIARPQVVERAAGTSHQLVHFTPDGWLARVLFGIELHGSLEKHLFRDGRKHLLGTLLSCRVLRSARLDVFEFHLDPIYLPYEE